MRKTIFNFLNKIISPSKKIKIIKTKSRQFPYNIEIISENLTVPWALDISDEGKIYFTERSGSIRVIENGLLNPKPLITFKFPFVSENEGGLMGLALDPKFSQTHYIYLMHSFRENNILYNKVVRLIEKNNMATIDKILLDKIPGSQFHNGGRIKIGPDKKLYITTGDAENPSLSQDISTLAGKILRIELNGDIPMDNPFTNSPVYSLGHRNPQGLAWNPRNILYSSEHGQSAHDEINIIIPGGNYGWPLVQGDETSTEITIQKHLVHSKEITWAPSGIAFINVGPWKDNLLVATLRGQQLLLISLNNEGTAIQNIEALLKGEYGRLREVVQGKDGSIYITTSNRDGRGNPSISDDRIIRLVLK
ncbi:PQQ-dependent sugar dehydrogenase [Clostridium sp. LP20]|uniref:PQQ-dependent sugar dehydrogenase n=1 Tax=Clostridium sp. LP20 TaxID=3418665 RepID=UPI003EE62577